jgi:hypothetical protein
MKKEEDMGKRKSKVEIGEEGRMWKKPVKKNRR